MNPHAHADPAGGLRALQEASGAELWVSEDDAEVVAAGGKGGDAFGMLGIVGLVLGDLRFPVPRIDHTFKDGAKIRVGDIELTAHVSAGHTRGCGQLHEPRLRGVVGRCSRSTRRSA